MTRKRESNAASWTFIPERKPEIAVICVLEFRWDPVSICYRAMEFQYLLIFHRQFKQLKRSRAKKL